jgi:hypothetical protein
MRILNWPAHFALQQLSDALTDIVDRAAVRLGVIQL